MFSSRNKVSVSELGKGRSEALAYVFKICYYTLFLTVAESVINCRLLSAKTCIEHFSYAIVNNEVVKPPLDSLRKVFIVPEMKM